MSDSIPVNTVVHRFYDNDLSGYRPPIISAEEALLIDTFTRTRYSGDCIVPPLSQQPKYSHHKVTRTRPVYRKLDMSR